jgi:two-component system phosphate regulon sensor histidine kinase PhoR
MLPRPLWSLLAALTPLSAVLVNLILTGQLDIPIAGLLWGASAVGMGGLLWPAALRLRAVDELVEGLVQTTGQPSPAGTPVLRKLDRLADSWRQERAQLQNMLDSRKTVLDLLPDPYLMIDAQSRIVRTNWAGQALFGKEIEDRPLSAAVREPTLLEAVATAVRTGMPQSLEWITSRPEERFFRVLVEPVPIQPHVRTRVIIAFSDITAARRSQRATTDFVANASHELRTPLTSLIGFIETLQGPAKDDPATHAGFLAIMHEQASRMARLVQDLLSLSRIERNLHQRPEGTVNLNDLAARAVQALTPQIESRRMQVALDLAAPSVQVIGDADELAQMCLNLVDNAIKYGDPETTVSIAVRIAGGSGVFAVCNQGEGIAPEDIPRLTERFFRAANVRSKGDGGTGLGLAIVQNIVQRHRGHLGIESVLGSHSQFTVTLPLSG